MTNAIEREAAIAVAEATGHPHVEKLKAIHEMLVFLELLRDGGMDGSPDEHRHLCPNKDCGTIWHHDRATLIGKDEDYYDRAHTCPKCGHKTRKKYIGTKPASCFYDGVTLKDVA